MMFSQFHMQKHHESLQDNQPNQPTGPKFKDFFNDAYITLVTRLLFSIKGSTPQEPLALVAKMSDSERSALESEGRDGLAHAEEPDTAPPEIPYHTSTSIQHSPAFSFRKFRLLGKVYYLLYADDYKIPSKVLAIYPVSRLILLRHYKVPPSSNNAFREWREPQQLSTPIFLRTYHAKEGHILFLRTNSPGLIPNKPMAIVRMENRMRGMSLEIEQERFIGWGVTPSGPSILCPLHC